MPLGAAYRAELTSHDIHWRWKVGLRVLIQIFNIVAIALIAWSIASGVQQYHSATGYNNDLSENPILVFDYIPVSRERHLERKRS